MLILDHESLEPFEPEIANLFDSAFGDALRGLAAVGLQPGDERHTEAARMFQAACLPAFRRAQDALGIRVLDLERQIASLERKEARARAKRDASTANESKVLRNVLQNRQLVFRRLIDAMLWTLIWPHKWLLRRLRLDGGIRSAKLSGSLIEYSHLRYIKASNARGHEMMFGARFFARVYLDLVRPNSLLAMAEELMEAAEKDKLAVARSVA